jgi:Acyl-protein synthetase, LuxE
MIELEQRIEHLLHVPPYGIPPAERESGLLELLKDEVEYAGSKNARLQNYVQHWPVPLSSAQRIADLPYLPVSMLKAQPPLSLVDSRDIKKTLTSSSTTGQVPSRVALDSATARRMSKGVMSIVRDFLGPSRRPYLVVDAQESGRNGLEMGARGAAIQGLLPFANAVAYCLHQDESGNLFLDHDHLLRFVESYEETPVLVYGFTYILWNHLVKPLVSANLKIKLRNVHVLHSGGWKRLQSEAVDKEVFNHEIAQVFGCSPDRVIDFYGMVENVGVIYPDCSEGNKHVPAFGDIIVRNPLTLEPVAPGEPGIVQVCSVLPTSFPGHLLLTEDLATIVSYDGCRCGRRGPSFRFVGRVPNSEVRGCGNIERQRKYRVNELTKQLQ